MATVKFRKIYNYDAYRETVDGDPEEAALYLNRATAALRAGLERPQGPFDALYEEAIYGDARELFSEVESLEKQANLADDKASAYELSGLIFAIGLGFPGW